MKEFIGAINSYHILNYLIPGTMFVLFLSHFSDVDLIQDKTFEGIILYYFIGMLISRIGSLALEPLFQILKILKRYTYEDYIKVQHLDERLDIFLEMRNMYRSILAMALILILIFVFEPFHIVVHDGKNSTYALIGLLIVVFAFAWQKQNMFLADRIKILKTNKFDFPEKEYPDQ